MAKTPRTWTGARTPSGLKRVRQAQSRHEVLQPRRSAAKTYVAKALAVAAAPADSSIDPNAALIDALSALDRAAKAGAIHPNAAARRKSRLTRKVNAALGGTTVQAGGHVTKSTGKVAAQKAAKARIAAGKAGKAKGAQTAAGKARAALSKTARAEAAAAKAAEANAEPRGCADQGPGHQGGREAQQDQGQRVQVDGDEGGPEEGRDHRQGRAQGDREGRPERPRRPRPTRSNAADSRTDDAPVTRPGRLPRGLHVRAARARPGVTSGGSARARPPGCVVASAFGRNTP